MKPSWTPTELYSAYLDLLKRSLGDFLYARDAHTPHEPYTYTDLRTGQKTTVSGYDALQKEGLLPSQHAHTLIGWKRMHQLQTAIETLHQENIAGDLMETGVLRGGACILMRGVLKALGCQERKVWVADSFCGFPEDALRAQGLADPAAFNAQAASLETVRATFARYRLLDEQVAFLAGFFEETLPAFVQTDPRLALLRLDSDFYDSTLYVLQQLYPHVVPGGFVIVDDYYAFPGCRQAVREYRKAHQITTPLERIDAVGVYWRKPTH